MTASALATLPRPSRLHWACLPQVLNKPKNNCVAVIGDGAITGGMAFS